MVTSKSAVGVAVVHDKLLPAKKRLQHSTAVVEMHAGDDAVRREEAGCSAHMDGRSETASNERIQPAANVQQHSGMRHFAAPLQENGAGRPL
jgi:hypothetical protein